VAKKCYINPTWNIKVITADGREVVEMPFLFLVHGFLKAYDHDPDNRLLGSKVVLQIGKASSVTLPLYLEQQPEQNKEYVN